MAETGTNLTTLKCARECACDVPPLQAGILQLANFDARQLLALEDVVLGSSSLLLLIVRVSTVANLVVLSELQLLNS